MSKPKHRSIRFVHRAPAPPAAVFPLLCPVRERDWVEGWHADVLHSDSGVAELGCVFVAGVHPTPGHAVFVVSRYEPPRAIEFVVLRSGLVEHLQIALEPLSSSTELVWRRTYTGLGDDGNAWIEASVPDAALARMRDLDRMLVGYLERGAGATLAAT